MTPKEQSQRRNRFYFYVLLWLVSVIIAWHSGYSVGKTVKGNEFHKSSLERTAFH